RRRRRRGPCRGCASSREWESRTRERRCHSSPRLPTERSPRDGQTRGMGSESLPGWLGRRRGGGPVGRLRGPGPPLQPRGEPAAEGGGPRRPPGVPCQTVPVWESHIMYPAAPTKTGAQPPGLAGRLFLFGREIRSPRRGEGSVIVALYDGAQDPPVMREEWRI